MKTTLLSLVICSLVLSGCVHAANKARTTHELITFSGTNVVSYELWTDESHGGGSALFADPQASGLSTVHYNQSALGGGRVFRLGSISSVVSTNGIKAVGGAIGNVVGEVGKVMLIP